MSQTFANNQQSQSVDPDEIGYFENLANDWWDESGPFAALQAMTPARVRYIKRHADRLLGKSLQGLDVWILVVAAGYWLNPWRVWGLMSQGLMPVKGLLMPPATMPNVQGLILIIAMTRRKILQTLAQVLTLSSPLK